MNRFINTVKKAAVDAVEASYPVNVLFGTVSTTNPLEVVIHQKLRLKRAQLILTRTAEAANLRNGDSVALLRVQGGQRYLILDVITRG